MPTIVDLLRRRAEERPDFRGFRFLRDGEGSEVSLTWGELDRRARAIGSTLRGMGAATSNVLLLYPPGLEFIEGLFGCLYGGAVPVPAFPPDPTRLQRTVPRVQAIVSDAGARFALTTKPLLALAEMVFAQAPDLRRLEWLATDSVEDTAGDSWGRPAVGADSLAMLQYTSGSTGVPKGVMLTHAHLLANAESVRRAFEMTPDDIGLSWLPMYHDMGFMAGILQPLYNGMQTIGMSPLAFLEKPYRWLAAIHATRATISGGPNFAYDLCVRKTTPEQRAGLDLSSWTLAFNGAEPIRLDTIDRFADTFAKSGFRRRAMFPCYGLAEATLIVSGAGRTSEPVSRRFDKTALEASRVELGDAVTLVACGRVVYEQTIAIVDPETGVPVGADRVGEIWVAGPSVAGGYWQRRDDTETSFNARVVGDERSFLRTGDLGFVRDGELFVCGRAKDLIIIRGSNHYPQDIELTVERAHPAIRPGCVAAFSVPSDDEERFAIVAEVDRRYQGNRRRLDRSDPDRRGADPVASGPQPEPLDVDQLFWVMRDAIAARHEIEPDTIVLVRAGSVPKTSSGKLQRRACRQAFTGGELEVLAEWRSDGKKRTSDVASLPRAHSTTSQPVVPPGPKPSVDIESLRKPSVLVVPRDRELLARSLALGHFSVVGADSAEAAVELAGKTKFAVAIGDDLATLAKIAEVSPHTARLVLTDFDDLEAMRDALAAKRISGVLSKRAGPQQIHAAVSEAVEEWVSHHTDVAIREIEKWLATWLAERLQHNVQVIDLDAPVASYGLDSLAVVEAQAGLADWLGQPVPDQLVRGKASIRSVARRLASTTPVTDRISRELPAIRAEDAAVAIVGMGCAVPRARDANALWNVIHNDVDAIAEIPADRLLETPGTRWGGALDGIADFDPAFFGIAPRDASHVDPQHRLLLETTWQALEDAGIGPNELAGSDTGVFVGLSGSDFLRWQPELAISDAPSAAAQRISYFFNLKGPSFVIDSGDASSMAALHLAVTSLQRGECKIAIAAGVNLSLTSRILDAYDKALLLSRDGRCKPLDARADGSVLSDGCGVVVLRRAADARASGSRIHANILATALGQNGRGHGLTAPNEAAQEVVIREAVRRANIRPADVGYVELNARGIPAVDGIEVRALASVIAHDRERPCVLGSLKANIGDTRAAAGVLGVIKAALVLEHDEMPRLLHLSEVHRDIALGDGFVAPTEARAWSSERRVACVDDFGLLGTNGVAVLASEMAAPPPPVGVEHPMHVLCVSARSEPALRVLAERYAERLASTPASELADVCFTANIGRAHFVQRAAVVASNPRDMRDELAAIARGELRHPRAPGRGAARIAFLFTGRGVAAPDMARQLFAVEPRFRTVMQRCDRIVREVLKRPLLSALYPVAGTSGWDPILEDPAMVAIEYALADLWQAWGIYPDLVMGHDIGEYAAAAVAGALGLEEAIALACHRARLLAKLEAPVVSATVVASEAEITAAIAAVGKPIAIAEHNGPRLFGVVGSPSAMQALTKRLAGDGVRTTTRPRAVPLHTPLVEPILDELANLASRLQLRAASIPLISNVTGKRFAGSLDAAHWRRHSIECVQFERGLRELIREGSDVFLEIGPRAMLAPVSTDLLGSWPGMLLASLDPKYGGDWEHMLSTLGALYERGVTPSWNGFYHGQERNRVTVPSYPFERKRCWPD
jgi:acyl transferase domain-containing protein/acyl-CoA synthetase (AMP-forming)/AMP-acid ligase II/acyl carrier protein